MFKKIKTTFQKIYTFITQLPVVLNQLLTHIHHIDIQLDTRCNMISEQLTIIERNLTELRESIPHFKSTLDSLQKTESSYKRIHKIPGIFINTMPKSGTSYISSVLSRSLNIELLYDYVAPGYFPNYFLLPSRLQYVLNGNVVRTEHFDANPINIFVLEKYKPKLVFHVRDPRQATLSWLHHVNRMIIQTPDADNYTIHILPVDYLNWPLEQQIDWHLEHRYSGRRTSA